MNITCTAPNDLDRAMMLARNPGDTITARNGTFATRGNWAFPDYRSLASGVRLDATGSTIRFSQEVETRPGGIVRPARDLNILWAGADCEIIGGTWDCIPPDGWYGGGIRFGGRYHLAGATITGLRGSWTQPVPSGGIGVEVFAVSSEGPADGSSVESVTVKDVTPNSYVSGIYVGATDYPTGQGDGSKVVLCSVDLGDGNQFGYSSSYKTTLSSCSCKGGKYGIYTDTGPMSIIAIGCQISASYAAISTVATSPAVRQIVAMSCELRGERCVEWWDRCTTGLMTGGIMITDCTIDSKYTSAIAGSGSNITFARNKMIQPVQIASASSSRPPMILV